MWNSVNPGDGSVAVTLIGCCGHRWSEPQFCLARTTTAVAGYKEIVIGKILTVPIGSNETIAFLATNHRAVGAVKYAAFTSTLVVEGGGALEGRSTLACTS